LLYPMASHATLQLPHRSTVKLNDQTVWGNDRALIPINGPDTTTPKPIDVSLRRLTGLIHQVQSPPILRDIRWPKVRLAQTHAFISSGQIYFLRGCAANVQQALSSRTLMLFLPILTACDRTACARVIAPRRLHCPAILINCRPE